MADPDATLQGIRIRINDININTVIYVAGLIVAVATFYANVNHKFQEISQRQDAYAESTEFVRKSLTDTITRFEALSADADKAIGTAGIALELHGQRLNILDERDADLTNALKEVRDAVERQRETQSRLSGDVRVVIQMLQQQGLSSDENLQTRLKK